MPCRPFVTEGGLRGFVCGPARKGPKVYCVICLRDGVKTDAPFLCDYPAKDGGSFRGGNVKAGDTVYSADGTAGEYIAPYSGGHVVALLYESEAGDEIYSRDVVSFEHVFTEPPRRKLDAEIKKRHEEAASLRAEVQALRSEKAEMERARVTSLKEMSKNAALARIEDFLAGRFTYFVEVPSWGCPSIKTKEALLKGGGVHEYDRETKLLTLFGKSNGDLQWGVSRYYDGSGGVTEVFPVEDEAEGLVMIRTFYAGHVAAWRSDPKKHTAVTWSHGLPTGTVDVPADLAFFIKDQERKSLEEREAKALADLCAIRSKIADAAK